MQEIAPNIYVETAYAPITVGAILTQEGWVVIDTPPMPKDAQAWRQTLSEISPKPIQYLINTDAQRERILGNVWFEATLIAQDAAAAQMLALKGSFLSQAADDMSSNDNELVAIASLRLIPPQVSFTDTLTIHCGEYAITLQHHHGATHGNCWVIVDSAKVLFAGDSLIMNQHPAIGDGISKAWLQSLAELQSDEYAGWTLIPGRGTPTQPAAAKALSEYLMQLRQRINQMVKMGKPRSEAAALAGEVINQFPFNSMQRDDIQRRVRSALEAVYDEMRSASPDDEIDDPRGF